MRWQVCHIFTTSSPGCRTTFLCRCLVLDIPNTSGFMCIFLEVRARYKCIWALWESVLNSHNFLFGYLIKLHHYILSVTFCPLPSLVVLSLGRLKGSRHYWLIALLGWPFFPSGNSASPVFKFISAASTKTLYGAATKKVSGDVISKTPSNGWVLYYAPTRACAQRLMSKQVSLDPFSSTSFQLFMSNPPRSSFKKLIISTLRLIQGPCTMSLAKAVPKGIKDKECKRFALWEPPPVP